MRDNQRLWLRRTEICLFLAAILCVCYFASIQLDAASAKQTSEGIVRDSVSLRIQDRGDPIKVDPNPGGSADATVIGRLEIPRLGLVVPVLSNYESRTLLKGVGHVPGTALPGGLGNVGIAGHRDTYFRPLRRIQRNMDIRLAGQNGVYHYKVDSTEVVRPDQVEVLDTHSRPELTLITCYPFTYIGAAPLRFIIHAHLLSVLPDDS
jgi:sortase A